MHTASMAITHAPMLLITLIEYIGKHQTSGICAEHVGYIEAKRLNTLVSYGLPTILGTKDAAQLCVRPAPEKSTAITLFSTKRINTWARML